MRHNAIASVLEICFDRQQRFAAFFFLLLIPQVVIGQSPVTVSGRKQVPSSKPEAAKKSSAPTTFIEFDLLQAPESNGLAAQQWLKILAPLDVTFRVHRPTASDKLEIQEKMVGKMRYITAVGALERSGRITFKDRSFEMAETEKLKEWLDELRTFGIQGSPTGQPLWGLTQEQFTEFFDGMTPPINFETEGVPLTQLVAKLPLPKKIALHWTADASEAVATRGERAKLRQELNGFSIGTVLAIALEENGLAFRPNRISSGDVELLIEPRNSKVEQWPVGWPMQRQPSKAAPKLNVMAPVELADVPLSDVINAIAKMSETPILIDYVELEARQINLEKVNVSFPRKMTTWGIALHRMIGPQKLTREYWQDEAGRVFVWITTINKGRVKDAESK